MPIFMLDNTLVFPPVELAEESGILAVGGDLSVPRLLAAYRLGIFPWYSEGEPLLWWSPDPRCVLFPDRLHVSRSMRRVLNSGPFRATMDRCFRDVITACRTMKRKGQPGTWITEEMVEAYCSLHDAGFAHSIEVWKGEELAGGLYGVSLGDCFFGESMFTRVSNASKFALIHLVQFLDNRHFRLLDCQVTTEHVMSLGAEEISRTAFAYHLLQSSEKETFSGRWSSDFRLWVRSRTTGEGPIKH